MVGDFGFIAKTNNGKIDQCVIDGNIKSSAVTSTNNGIISNIIIKGNIGHTATATAYSSVSGICDTNNGTINNVYIAANITSTSKHSSAIAAFACVSNNGVIQNVFATGNMSVRAAVSGSIDGYSRVYITYLYSDSESGYYNCYTSNQSSINSSLYTDGVSIENLQNLNFIKFGKYVDENNLLLNPDNVWVDVEGDYPKLFWEE